MTGIDLKDEVARAVARVRALEAAGAKPTALERAERHLRGLVRELGKQERARFALKRDEGAPDPVQDELERYFSDDPPNDAPDPKLYERLAWDFAGTRWRAMPGWTWSFERKEWTETPGTPGARGPSYAELCGKGWEGGRNDRRPRLA